MTLEAFDQLVMVGEWRGSRKRSESFAKFSSPANEGKGRKGTNAVGFEDTAAFCGLE